ncbi:enoyl-CoA hydratase [Microbacterium sp. Root61]|uniref:enoyl-CoA hydratase/isomerase family protein n=1 Tax=Microbacterium sp. Root61 TaxID=1736570 RepID=UPI0006FBD0A9|nr:enoyl-CoA hydratase/isomerase family protein [Microbacterium sp. Root61]KRA24670.1 enoyl-CoA hydratase [Microbacterium sp. Root61]
MTNDTRFPTSPELLTEVVGTTLVVTLNRPTRANALDATLIRALRELWPQVATDTRLRCVVLTGAGNAFCAGADVAMLAAPRIEIGATAAAELSFVPGPHLNIPVIAAVNGVCAGGGLHFVADADIVVAADVARFIDPHVSVGQVSGLEPIELLMRMRRDLVARMALLGSKEVLDATTAQAAGLVSQVVAPGDLLPMAMSLAAQIAQGSPEAQRVTRQILRDFEADLVREHLDRGWQAVQDHWTHPDAVEGPTAFAEKRAPQWAPPRS